MPHVPAARARQVLRSQEGSSRGRLKAVYLVDTSVWADYLRGRDRPHVGFLRDLLSNPVAVGITHLIHIYMEVLQGARDTAAFDRLQSYFGGQRFHSFEDPAASHASAARICMDCRQGGVTVRSAADCLIAQCALGSGLILFHHDRDFERIASVVPALVEKSFIH